MKLSKSECLILALCAVFLAFTAGWLLRGRTTGMIQVETQRAMTAAPAVPSASTDAPEKGLVDLNTAGVEELKTLPGIGEKRAADIIADRKANGPYHAPEDLTRVKGIGEETVQGLLEYVTVSEEKS